MTDVVEGSVPTLTVHRIMSESDFEFIPEINYDTERLFQEVDSEVEDDPVPTLPAGVLESVWREEGQQFTKRAAGAVCERSST